MAGVRGDIRLIIDLNQSGTGDLGTPKLSVNVEKVLSLIPGTDAVNKANILFQDTRTLAASANEDLDLVGVLTDAFGATINTAEVLLVYISASTGNTNAVEFGPAASAGALLGFKDASDRLVIRPGKYACLANGDGWAITATTADKVNIANAGAGSSVTYDIIIVGRTVAA